MSLFQAFLEAPSSGSLFSLSAAYRGVEITRDVVYGDDPRHQLDVYRPPEGVSVNAVILFIYGGGWD
ncbi:MAG: hypothetical protein ACR2OM_12610, partial [Aestuariivirgaceae bacterium]